MLEKSEDGRYVGQIPEAPEVFYQGRTIDELKENLLESRPMMMETIRNGELSQIISRPFFINFAFA